MEIYFVRHAEKEKDVEDPWLTERGIKQAKLLAKRLKEEKFTHFYCSDTKRTKQTAEYLVKEIGMKPEIVPCLNEYSSKMLKTDTDEWEEGEAIRYTELLSFLKKISAHASETKKILIIAHGVTNRLIMAALLDINLQNIIRFAQLEATINVAYWVERFGNWRLRYWNDNNYLPSELRHSLDGY